MLGCFENPLVTDSSLDPRPLPSMHMRRRCSALTTNRGRANVVAMSISAHSSLLSDEPKSINRRKSQYSFIVAELFEYSPVHDCSFILFFHRSRMQMAVSLKRDC